MMRHKRGAVGKPSASGSFGTVTSLPRVRASPGGALKA